MIKLIAADLDGTLLDSHKQLPAALPDLLRRLRARGIRFMPASGRQYYNLAALFPESAQELLFIAENGAMTVDCGHTLFVDDIPPADLVQPIALTRQAPHTYAILAGEHSAYCEDDDPVFMENAQMYYARLERVPDLLEAAQHDRVCKIAVFEHGNAEKGCYPLLKPLEKRFQVVLSGADWVDLMNPGVNKGTAMQKIQKALGILPEECMAFGDYLNDKELLEAVTHSFAMANAHPALKASHIAPSNDEDGVVRAVWSYLGLGQEMMEKETNMH